MTVPMPARAGAGGDADDDDADDDVGSDAAEQFVHRHPWVLDYARVGWAAKGVVYLLTGVLAFIVATRPSGGGGGSNEADPSGAIAKIAEQPFGTALLWAMGVGLLVYATWRLFTVALPADIGAHAVLRRIGYLISAITYVALALTAISLARRTGASSGSSGGQDSRVTGATADVMAWTGGRWIVGVAGVVVIGVGAYFLWKGVTASFENELEHRQVGPFSWRAVRAMGRAGWVGRATMMGLIGVFVVRAAWRFDPDEARGLDDSLRRVADSSIGMALVFVVAVGLTLYGAFCVISAPARKLVASDEDTVAS